MSSFFSCFASKQKDAGAERSAEIEKTLRKDQRRLEKEVKILLLGAGESGKSTVLKQMRLIYSEGFKTEERTQWRVVVFNNLMQSFQIILRAMEDGGITFDHQDNAKYIEMIAADPEIGPSQPFPMEYLSAFTSLWVDKGVQSAVLKGNEYALHDNLDYYFGDINRLFAKNYIPTDQDILRARLRTTGISETLFDFPEFPCRMFDVGGQRSERKKWIHCFENVQVVLFMVAISAYDHVLVEDQNSNQMVEALSLFESIANSRWFARSAVILFMNKMDLFREKVSTGRAPIKKSFPDYHGSDTDVEAGQKFFTDRFHRLVRDQSKTTYTHYTNATDTDLLSKTMTSVKDMIVQKNLNKFGLL